MLKFWRNRGQAEVVRDDDPTSSFGDELLSLAQNLITLEINTIIKENMIAGPMPSIQNALIEIARSYIKTFERLGIDVSRLYPPAPEPNPEADPPTPPAWREIALKLNEPAAKAFFGIGDGELFCFRDLFLCLQRAAHLVGFNYAHERPLSPDAITVRRIEDNADKLRVILEGNNLGTEKVSKRMIESGEDVARPKPDLKVSERLTIKKIWEVGSERVIAQTVIQLDGDIVTRLASDFGAVQDVDKLLALHEQGLGTAIGRWDSLMKAAIAVIRGLTGTLTGALAGAAKP